MEPEYAELCLTLCTRGVQVNHSKTSIGLIGIQLRQPDKPLYVAEPVLKSKLLASMPAGGQLWEEDSQCNSDRRNDLEAVKTSHWRFTGELP